jgi:predicted dehydrogenase
VVAVDSHIGRLGEALSNHPGIDTVLDAESAFADPEVGAVMIATPMASHFALAAQALERGMHVFVEKPMASSVEEAEELTRMAKERSLTMMVGHTFLFSPAIRTIAGHIRSGATGPIHYITSSRLSLGLYRPDANVIWDLAPHDFSIIFSLLGENPSSAQTIARSQAVPGIPDVAFINLTFPSGAIAQVSVSWLAPHKVRNTTIVGESKMICFDESNAEEPVKIFDRGVVVEEGPDFRSHQLTYRFGATVAPVIDTREPLALEVAHFLACAEQGVPCESDGDFGVNIVRALAAADESWRRGGIPVPVNAGSVVAPFEVDLRLPPAPVSVAAD